MRLFNFLLLFSMVALSGCSGLGGSMSTEAIEPIEHEEKMVSLNTKYLSLLDIVERMRVFTEEEKSNLEYPDFDSPDKYSSEAISKIGKNLATHSSFVEGVYEQTLNLLNKKQGIDEYLSFLLACRYNYLQSRQNFIEETLSGTTSKGISMFPTDKNLFDFLMQDEGIGSKSVAFNELARIYAVSRFELLNLLIKESFAKCTLDELKTETINLLRASVQLHPILTGERKDLGHPDEAGGLYSVLEPMVIQPKEQTARASHGKKLKKLLNVPYWSETAKKHNGTCANRQLLSFLFDLIKSNADLKIDEQVLGIKRELDLAMYDGHYSKAYPLFVPFKNLGTPQDPTHGVNILATAYEIGKWPYELPDPEFLRKPQIDELTDNNRFFEPLEDKRHLRRTRTNRIEMLLKAQPVEVKVTVGEEAKELQEATQQSSAWIKEELIEEEKEETEEPSMEPQPNDFIEPSKAFVSEPAKVFSFTRDWELPQGLRSFHSQMLKYTYPVRALNGKYQRIVNQLFDSKQQCNVCFREFKTLWEAAEGQIISNHSGSHQELIGPQHEKLFGIFAHNNSQTYGKKSVQYLQTAVLYVGLRPT